jgi:hypothetical protein
MFYPPEMKFIFIIPMLASAIGANARDEPSDPFLLRGSAESGVRKRDRSHARQFFLSKLAMDRLDVARA